MKQMPLLLTSLAAFPLLAGNYIIDASETSDSKYVQAMITPSVWKDGSIPAVAFDSATTYQVSNRRYMRLAPDKTHFLGGKLLVGSNASNWGGLVGYADEVTFDNQGLALQFGCLYVGNGANKSIDIHGTVNLVSGATWPIGVYSTAENDTIRFCDTFLSDRNATMIIGHWINSYDSTTKDGSPGLRLELLGDYSGVKGTLSVTSAYDNVSCAARYGSLLVATTGSMPGAVRVDCGGAIGALTAADTFTVGSLTFGEGASIRVKYDSATETCGCVAVATALTVNGPVTVTVDMGADTVAASKAYPILVAPAGIALDANDFTFVPEAATFPQSASLVVGRNETDTADVLFLVFDSSVYIERNTTVASLTMGDGTLFTTKNVSLRDGDCNWLKVTGALTVNGKIRVNATNFAHTDSATGECVRMKLIEAPAGTVLADSQFEFVPNPQYEASASNNHPQRAHIEVESSDQGVIVYLVIEPIVALQADDPNSKWLDTPGSAFTNANSWSDVKVPHADAHYAAARRLRMTFDDADYDFPGLSLMLIGSEFHFYGKRIVSIPVLEWQNGELWTGEGSDPTLTGGIVKTFAASTKETIRTMDGIRLRIASELTGDGNIVYSDMNKPRSVAMSGGAVELLAENTNFLGTIKLTRQYNVPSQTVDYVNRLFVGDVRNLGGRLPTFNPKALELGAFGTLAVEKDVTLADGLNRGIYINGDGSFEVPEGRALTVGWTVTVDGILHKLGAGTVEFAGCAAVGAGGSGSVDIHAGALRIGSAECVDGLTVKTEPGGEIVLPLTTSDPDLAKYGLCNLSAEPFAIGEGMSRLAIRFDRQETIGGPDVRTNVLMTVAADRADAVIALLPRLKPYADARTTVVRVPAEGKDGAVTLLGVSQQSGMAVIIR